jgi:uncharacterized membrane protein/DNA-binding beta-propeller fold protein YncE
MRPSAVKWAFFLLSVGAALRLAAIAASPTGSPSVASFQGLGDLPGGERSSVALGISGDGLVVVGYGHSAAGAEAFRWRDGALVALSGPPGEARSHTIAHACSSDGSVVVGSASFRGATQAVRWQQGILTALAGAAAGVAASDAWGVSADGETIVGEAKIDGRSQAVAWRRGSLVSLDVDADSVAMRMARAVSADGSVVVGAGGPGDGERAFRNVRGRVDVLRGPEGTAERVLANGVSADGLVVVGAASTERGHEAIRWRGGSARGLGGLAAEHEYFSAAHDVSADGSRVVGTSEGSGGVPEAFVWDEAHGMRPLREVLVRQHGLDLSGWTLAAATAISDDGLSIAGYGRNPRGETEAWIARLPAESNVAAQRAMPAAAAAPGPGRSFGEQRARLRGLDDPGGAAIDGAGNLYVADTGADRVCVFDRDGALHRCVVEAAGKPPLLSAPTAVAIGSDGGLVVLDSGHDRVVTYDADGRPRLAFGGSGGAPGRLARPRGLAARGGRIAVADTGNDRVQLFDERGAPLAVFGRSGSGPGELHGPTGVAFDDRGRLWVADTGNHRLFRFDEGGAAPVVAGGPGRLPGFLLRPTAPVWHAGELHVVDTGNDRVQVFAGDGAAVRVWARPASTPREAGGRLRGPAGLAIAASGDWATVCEPVEDRCQVLAAAAPPAGAWSPPAPENVDLGEQLTVDGNLVAVIRPERDEVELRDLDAPGEPRLLALAGGHGAAPGKLIRPAGVALDLARRRLIVSDAENLRLQVFGLGDEVLRGAPAPAVPPPQAPFLRAVSTAGMFARLRPEAAALPTEPGALAVDADGSLYLVDAANGAVLALDERLSPRRVLAIENPATGAFAPRDVAVDRRTGAVLVLGAGRVEVFARDGRPLGGFAVEPSARGIAVDGDGSPWVVGDPSRLQRLDAQGKLLQAFGRPGVGRGELHKPRDVGVDGRGRLVVLDWGNRRVLVLSPDGAHQSVFGAALYAYPARREPTPSGAPAEIASAGAAVVVRYAPAPAEIPLNEPFALWVRLLDAADREPLEEPVELGVDAEMPAHRHGMTTRPQVARNEDGSFTVRGMLFHMPGEWQLHFDVTREGTTERTTAAVVLE